MKDQRMKDAMEATTIMANAFMASQPLAQEFHGTIIKLQPNPFSVAFSIHLIDEMMEVNMGKENWESVKMPTKGYWGAVKKSVAIPNREKLK